MIQNAVNHPEHYTVGGIETLEFIKAKLSTDQLYGYCIGNIMKYLSRADYKGKRTEDVKKAAFYMDVLNELVSTEGGE